MYIRHKGRHTHIIGFFNGITTVRDPPPPQPTVVYISFRVFFVHFSLWFIYILTGPWVFVFSGSNTTVFDLFIFYFFKSLKKNHLYVFFLDWHLDTAGQGLLVLRQPVYAHSNNCVSPRTSEPNLRVSRGQIWFIKPNPRTASSVGKLVDSVIWWLRTNRDGLQCIVSDIVIPV